MYVWTVNFAQRYEEKAEQPKLFGEKDMRGDVFRAEKEASRSQRPHSRRTLVGGAFASNATPAVLVGGAHLRGATHIGTRHLFSLRRAHLTQMRLLRRLPRRLHGRFYCSVVLVRRYVFNCICSVVLVRRYIFNCICSVVLVRRYVFNCICSVVLVRRYVFNCICSVVLVRRYNFN